MSKSTSVSMSIPLSFLLSSCLLSIFFFNLKYLHLSSVGLPDYTPLIEVINPENITLSGPGHGEGVLDLNVCFPPPSSLSSSLISLVFPVY